MSTSGQPWRSRRARYGQEGEARLGELRAPLAGEHLVEPLLERVQVEHVVRGVVELVRGELVRAPVGGLLLLGYLDAEQVAAKVLEAVAVGEGARKARGDLRAIDRRAADPERVLQHRDIEAGEVEDLQHFASSASSDARWGAWTGSPDGKLHQMAVAIATRELHQAEPVPMRVEAHRLGVDRHRIAEGEPRRQVAAMEVAAPWRAA